MRRALRIVLAAGLVASLAACGEGETEATTALFHAVPDDFAVVTGTATTCEFSNAGVNPEGGAGFLVVCEFDMSDPRVSGTYRSDQYRFFKGGDFGDVWVAEAEEITNSDGKWRGSSQAADDSTPCGESHFIGEDAYEGLEFHYYFCHVGDPAQIRGWISGG